MCVCVRACARVCVFVRVYVEYARTELPYVSVTVYA